MKKIIKLLLLFVLFLPSIVYGKEINIYLFYGDGCPHCALEKEFLAEYMSEDNEVRLHKYEVWYSEENRDKFLSVQNIIGKNATGVPYLVVGKTAISGFSEDSTEETIKGAIKYYKEVDYYDEVGVYLGIIEPNNQFEEISQIEVSTTAPEENEYKQETFNIPLLGKKNAKEVSLGLSAVVIGLVDGFNPCAMWILILLISMLLGMKNRKRMWALGITFLFTSAFIYFLFMISWLNLAEFLNEIIYIRIAIGMFAVIFGTVSILRYLKTIGKDAGCEVVNTTKRKKIIYRIQSIVKEKSFVIALLGVILLAVSVNIIELLCSLGLPVMYTEILALNEVSNSSKIFYTIIYILFFLLDDLIIFIIAMKTLEIKVISNKYNKYSHLIGGLIMLLIGLLILFKPEWIMFNF